MTTYRTDRTEPTEKLLQEKLKPQGYHTDLKLIYAAYHVVRDELTIQS